MNPILSGDEGRCFRRERIVCLTEETVETLYLLGEQRPHRRHFRLHRAAAAGAARKAARLRLHLGRHPENPRRSSPISFSTFSDLQADIAADAHPRGRRRPRLQPAHASPEILDMIRTLGALVGAARARRALADALATGSRPRGSARAQRPRRPKVYFEEWDEPMISGIAWVSELIEIAGGDRYFRRSRASASPPRTASSRPTK